MEPYRERTEDFIRRWQSRYEGDRVFRALVITVVIAAVAVASAGLQQRPIYEASAVVLVGWEQEGPWQTLEYRELPAPEIVRTIGAPGVAKEAIQRLGLQMGVAELVNNLTVEQDEGTQFVRLTYESTDPYKAKRIVNTVGEVSSEFISERSSQLTATVWEKAAVPTTPASPRLLRNGLLALVIGLVLCAGTVVASRDARARGERPTRQGVGIVGRVKEKKLLLALGRRGKLTAVEAALETGLSVEEANRILEELAFEGQLEVTVEHGKLFYSFWGHEAP